MYRSKFESQFAAVVVGKSVKYETDKIKYEIPASKHTYTPDFTLAPNVYIETKGRFVASDRKKHLLIKKQHPEITILFVFMNARNTITKTSKTTYADWAKQNDFQYIDWSCTSNEAIKFTLQNLLKPKKVL